MISSSKRMSLFLAAYCSLIIFPLLTHSTAFVMPPRTSLMALAEEKTPASSHSFVTSSSMTTPLSRTNRSRGLLFSLLHQRHRSTAISPLFISSTSTAQADNNDSSSSASKTKDKKKPKKASSSPTTVHYLFENYNKPIVLLGLSSSPANNELQRLALSLSGALVGNNPMKMQDTLERLQRSQGAALLGDDDDDDDDDETSNRNIPSSSTSSGGGNSAPVVTGISLSTIGLDDEGPFVLDAELIRDFIRDKTLSLTTGVIVIDFNHAAFTASEDCEVDLIRALGMVAKELYEDEKLLSVYVNVQPGEGIMSDDAKERKRMIEKEVLIPFSDYELCIKNEGIETEVMETVGKKNELSSTSSWNHMEWELQRIIARALLPAPVVGGTGSTTPNNNADITMGKNTFFLSLSFPQVEDASPYVEQMCQDVDSMEYRVDLLSAAKDYLSMKKDESCNSDDPRFDILYQQQRLRALCRPHAQR